MPDNGFLPSVGVHAADALAGLSGGVVKAFLSGARRPGEVLISAVIGGMTANYLTTSIAALSDKFIGTPLDGGAMAFAVGLSAMAICQKLISKIGEKMRFGANGGNNV